MLVVSVESTSFLLLYMRVRIKGKGPKGEILNQDGDVARTRRSILKAARELRQSMTPAEKILWSRLRGRKLGGFKFYRQVPIDRYIVDFYCPEKKLVVEVDGSIHDEEDMLENDEFREKCFRNKGLRIIRFRNAEMFRNLNDVCNRIDQMCKARIT